MEGREASGSGRLTTAAPPAKPLANGRRPRAIDWISGYRLGYQPGLDGIRGISVVLIMLFHSFILWRAFYGTVVPGAYITVNMFFVLSGFLITSLLLEEWGRHNRLSYRSFYVRRVLRLLPALLFVLLVYFIYVVVTGAPLGPELAAIGWIASYAANWARWAGKMSQIGTSLSWGHTWTLAVEEQFYIVWPWVLTGILLLRPKLRTVVWVLLAAVAAVTAARWYVTLQVPVHATLPLAQRLEEVVGIRTDLRADTLLLGALAAVILHAGWRPGRWFRGVAAVVLAALLYVSFFVQPDARWMYMWGFTLVDAGGALLCIAVLDKGWSAARFMSWRPFAWLGRLSYALYLWHPPVFVAVVVHAPQWPDWEKLVVAWIITFAGACLSYYCVETPFLKLKGRFSRTAHGSTPPIAAAAVAPVTTG